MWLFLPMCGRFSNPLYINYLWKFNGANCRLKVNINFNPTNVFHPTFSRTTFLGISFVDTPSFFGRDYYSVKLCVDLM